MMARAPHSSTHAMHGPQTPVPFGEGHTVPELCGCVSELVMRLHICAGACVLDRQRHGGVLLPRHGERAGRPAGRQDDAAAHRLPAARLPRRQGAHRYLPCLLFARPLSMSRAGSMSTTRFMPCPTLPDKVSNKLSTPGVLTVGCVAREQASCSNLRLWWTTPTRPCTWARCCANCPAAAPPTASSARATPWAARWPPLVGACSFFCMQHRQAL